VGRWFVCRTDITQPNAEKPKPKPKNPNEYLEAASVGGLFHFKPSIQCRLLARNGPPTMSAVRSLSGGKRTWRLRAPTSEFDPHRTLVNVSKIKLGAANHLNLPVDLDQRLSPMLADVQEAKCQMGERICSSGQGLVQRWLRFLRY
jgi:hypothetical protein